MTFRDPDAIQPAREQYPATEFHQWDRQAWGRSIMPARGGPTKSRKRNIFERDNYRCRGCGTEGTRETLTIDHIRPKLLGGSNHPDNLQTMCPRCNVRKGSSWDGRSGFPKV